MSSFFSYRPTDLSRVPLRTQNSHKGTYGRVLVVGGSVCMSGAAYFAAKAAYRMGAGLVHILTHKDNRIILQTQLPEAILSTYGDDVERDRETVLDAVSRADAIVVGVGLGQSEQAKRLLSMVLSQADAPLVIDADALNILAKHGELWEQISAPVIVTPHPLEMARLCHMDVSVIERDRLTAAVNFSEKYALVCVLKGHNTIVSDGAEARGLGDEHTVYLNHSGNSGMATGGSGDVLSGIIASLIAQKMLPFDAATLGVYIHGLAGDAAAEALGEYSVMASDIIDHISEIIKDCHEE
ncbi:MAG: NAD(P)H-hydrate dehydratase [Clostridia bacterium]|nr:NAD(P)H-hydrate dehydratase [Clostridia bacterium]